MEDFRPSVFSVDKTNCCFMFASATTVNQKRWKTQVVQSELQVYCPISTAN